MKSKWQMFASLFQIVVGIAAILSYFVLASGGEDMTKWIITLILAVLYVILGIIGIIENKTKK